MALLARPDRIASPAVRLLFVEDDPNDVDLELQQIRRAGIAVIHRAVQTAQSLVDALREFAPDLILSDFSMPGFGGIQALGIVREHAPEIPFIFVSGRLGEEHAIRALKSGATDYVLKGNLARLPVAVERALAESHIVQEQRRTRTELEIARERLQESEAGLRRAQLMAKLAHVITGPGGTFESWSENLPRLIGMEPSEMPRSTREWADLLDEGDRGAFLARCVEAARTGARVSVEYRLRRGDGACIDVRQVIEPLGDGREREENARWFSTLQDVTEEKQNEAKIRRLNRVYAVLSGINAVIVREPQRQELFEHACRIAVEAGGLRMAWVGLFDGQRKAIKPAASFGHEDGFLSLMSLAMDDPTPEVRGLVRRAVRQRRPVILHDIAQEEQFRLRAQALKRGYRSAAVLPLLAAGEVLGVVGLFAGDADFFDEAEMRLLSELAGHIGLALNHLQKSERLDYLAYYDALTGLANRTLLRERLGQYLHAARENDTQLALVILDLERFSAINQTLGRAAGDALLVAFAQRLREVVHDSNQIARVSGNHFALILPLIRSLPAASSLLDDVAKALAAVPFRLEGKDIHVSARAGVALFPHHGGDADTLLRSAEAAVARGKRSGERQVFFDPSMTQRAASSLTLENAMRRALEREQFVLHYQPKVDLKARRIVGAEALIRWQSDKGLVPPVEFIPLLEETGLILEVGAWVLKRAALQHKEWRERGIDAPRIAVNVSAVQLRQSDFVSRVKHALASGVQPTGLDVEITESMVMEDIAGSVEKLNAVRQLGIQVAIDDFGIGYSSLAYLAKLPLASLKIDRSFIITMLGDANTMTLVSTIISMARALGLKAVAEGVDTEEQAAALRNLQCDEMQGYLYSKPLAAESFAELLTAP